MDSRLVWMTLERGRLRETPQSLPLTVPFPPLHREHCTHSHHHKITSKQ